MHAMKEALKIHMMKAKMKPEAKAEDPLQLLKKDEEEELGDNAPEAKPHMDGELGPEHMHLLEQLLAQISHPGREAMTMGEKSVPLMKEKMASMSKHKKSI